MRVLMDNYMVSRKCSAEGHQNIILETSFLLSFLLNSMGLFTGSQGDF